MALTTDNTARLCFYPERWHTRVPEVRRWTSFIGHTLEAASRELHMLSDCRLRESWQVSSWQLAGKVVAERLVGLTDSVEFNSWGTMLHLYQGGIHCWH